MNFCESHSDEWMVARHKSNSLQNVDENISRLAAAGTSRIQISLFYYLFVLFTSEQVFIFFPILL